MCNFTRTREERVLYLINIKHSGQQPQQRCWPEVHLCNVVVRAGLEM